MAKKSVRKTKSVVNKNPNEIRLNKWIASTGLMSRRKADEIIDQGLIKINGRVVYELGVKINPKEDVVKYENKVLKPPHDKTYVMFNKPKKVLTSLSDPAGRPTVGDFFPSEKLRLFPVGRLDWETEGLLLLTNDGEFSQEVLHPKSHIPKTYLVKLSDKLSAKNMSKLLNGVTIIGGRVKALHVERVKKLSSKVDNPKYEWVRISIAEGKNRQVRRMFEKIGLDVKKLRRVGIGSLKLGALATGEARELKASDLLKIFEQVKFAKRKDITPRSSNTTKKKSTRGASGSQRGSKPLRSSKSTKKTKSVNRSR